MSSRPRSTARTLMLIGMTCSLIASAALAGGSTGEPAEKHWAYVPPVRSNPPAVSDPAWPINAIDHFILARLDAEGLAPSPPADRAQLIRRVYLDLIGLPPSIEAVDAFINDPSPNAYEKVVDRLLASPRYGERWARPWLDLARYADSHGYQSDQMRTMWAYRDWVIEAINDDMPFDQFTIEQLAGDLLPNATKDQRIATGFHRTVTVNIEAGVDPEENRVNQVIDRVNTTGTVWLGSTVECAQCHDHKYDPVSQEEYYQLFAYFNNTPLEVEHVKDTRYDFVGPMMDLPMPPDREARHDRLQKRLEAVQRQLKKHTAEAAEQQPAWERRTAEALENPPEWTVLDVAAFESGGGASHTILEDGSVLLQGEAPGKDVYTVTAHTDLSPITGFKLEALTHPSLPGTGPGRGDEEKSNFVLHEFTVTAADREKSESEPGSEPRTAQPVALRDARADFSQNNWHVSGLIDGDAKTGWAIAPKFHEPHHATFRVTEPIDRQGGATLTFTLDQHHGNARTIGRLRLSATTGGPGAEHLPKPIAAALKRPDEKRTKKQAADLREHYLGTLPEIKELRGKVAGVKKQLEAAAPPTTLVMVEMDEPRETTLFKRGNFLTPGDTVQPATPAMLHDMDPDAPQNRLGLARWLVDGDNPLVGRVTVNRWWTQLFGRGIVKTVGDFGIKGEPPTHPDLLDWLAVEFVEAGWSRKAIHRLIVTSAAYRQSSRVSPELLEADPYNELYARGARFRLSAEAIRDNALTIAGVLSEEMGGPPVQPPQPDGIWRHVGRNAPTWETETDGDRFRRGLYIVWRRSAPYPSFMNFDAPDRTSCAARRPRTNTSLQALTLMNDTAYVELALALAARVLTDRPEAGAAQRAEYAFRLCLARPPGPDEADHLQAVYHRERAHYDADPKAAEALLRGDTETPGRPFDFTDHDPRELAAWFHVAHILLNLDETITKE